MHRYAEDIEERKENLYRWRMTDQAKIWSQNYLDTIQCRAVCRYYNGAI